MESYIAILVNPASWNMIYAIENGEQIAEVRSAFHSIPETIMFLAQKYDLHTVKLAGLKDFTEKTKANIQQHKAANYANFKLDIEIV